MHNIREKEQVLVLVSIDSDTASAIGFVVCRNKPLIITSKNSKSDFLHTVFLQSIINSWSLVLIMLKLMTS